MARIRTVDRKPIPEVHFRDEIIAQSRQKYCLPVAAVQEMIRHRHRRSGERFSPLVPTVETAASGKSAPARLYDEW